MPNKPEPEVYRGVFVPTKPTIRRYGGTVEAWKALLDDQGGVCGVCGKLPTKGRLVIDHEHVRGWKAMPPEQRWQYVRGLVCWFCNHYYLGRGLTLAKARGVVRFLEAYEARKR